MKFLLSLFPAFISLLSIGQNVGINTAAPNAALDVYGEMALKSAALTTPDGINYALDVSSNKFSNYKLTGPTANFVIAGITAGVDGVIVTLHNRTGHSMELYNEDITATDVNRISTSTGATLAIYNNGNVTLQYDGGLQRWQVIFAHNYSLNFFGGGGGGAGFWTAIGDDIYNSNTGNVGIGLTNPARAKLEINGAAGTGYTSALFGGDGTGISFQRNWPTIGFNQYRDLPTGYGKAISSGYGAHIFINPVQGGMAVVMHDSVAADAEFGRYTYSVLINKMGNVGIQTTSDNATFSIGGGDNFPSHFNYGAEGHTYLRGGDREYRNLGNIQWRPSKVFINDIAGYNSLTGSTYPGGDVIIATGGGSVGIGTENTAGYKLAVNGSIRAKELRINTGWADYVFDENYQLKSLTEVEQFIAENKHLPDIPAASFLQKEGVDVSAMQTKMMAKIEELTLYMIEANKKIIQLQNKLNKAGL